MASLTNIASSSLTAYKIALETVGSNIANVNTEGYSRQSVNFTTTNSQNIGKGYIGGGVSIGSIERAANAFKTRFMNDNLSDYHLHKEFYDRASVIDSLFSQEGSNLSSNIQEFFNALEQANEMPDSLPPRNVAMGQAQFLADQIRNIQDIIDQSQSNLEQQLVDVTKHMSSLADSIANINAQVSAGNKAPELLDARDNYVKELAKYISVNTTVESNGSMNVTIGRGESLVIGSTAGVVSVAPDPETGRSTLHLNIGGAEHEITRNIVGGTVEAMVNYENNVLGETSRQIGLISMALAENFNNQNQLGLNYDSEIGSNIFTDYNAANLQSLRSISSPNNSDPNVSANILIEDVSALENSDYTLTMTSATSGTLLRQSDGELFNITTIPSSVDGFNISFSSPVSAGDTFSISPTRDMGRYMQVINDDPKALALASPISVMANSANLSDAAVKLTTVNSTTNPDLKENFEFRITALNPTASDDFSYELFRNGVSQGIYNASYEESISVPNTGYALAIIGSVKIGDSFTSQFNQDGIGDNSNGVNLTNLQQLGLINDGRETLIDRYSHMIADLGTITYESNIRADSADILYRQAEAQKLSEVGVSLDEEAANLVALQQAYQASGQLVAVSKQMMDIVFSLIT